MSSAAILSTTLRGSCYCYSQLRMRELKGTKMYIVRKGIMLHKMTVLFASLSLCGSSQIHQDLPGMVLRMTETSYLDL